jgi:hypothetical protein
MTIVCQWTWVSQEVTFARIQSSSTSRMFCWETPNSRPISRDILHSSRSMAAIVASSLNGVRTLRGRAARTQVLWVLHFGLMETQLQSLKSISTWMTSTRMKNWGFLCMFQYYSSAYSTIIQTQLSRTIHCVSWVAYISTRCLIVVTTLLRNVLLRLKSTRTLKPTYLERYVT